MPQDNTPTMGKFVWKEKSRRRKLDQPEREEDLTALPGPELDLERENQDDREEREEGEIGESPALRRSRRNLRSEEDGDNSSDEGTEDSPEEKELPEGKRIKIHTSAMHQCEMCGKVYKHKNCLAKHGWEHHESWQMTKKWCQTKHQQVQMLEAAHVLVEMTGKRELVLSALPGKPKRRTIESNMV